MHVCNLEIYLNKYKTVTAYVADRGREIIHFNVSQFTRSTTKLLGILLLVVRS